MNFKVRPVVFALHQWTGVVLGLLLVVICVSGSVLVFSEEINRTLHPQWTRSRLQGEPISPAAAIGKLRTAYADSRLLSLRVPPEPDGTYMGVLLSGERLQVSFVDPRGGALIGGRIDVLSVPVGFLLLLHTSLLAGAAGGIVVGIAGVLLTVLGLSGLVLWPGWRRWQSGLRVRWRSPSRLLHYDLHKVSGVFSAALLVLIALTGSALVFHDPVEGWVYQAFGQKPPEHPVSTVRPGIRPLDIERVLDRARAVVPQATVTNIALPTRSNGVVYVTLRWPPSAGAGLGTVALDQYSASVLRVDNPRRFTPPEQVMQWLYPLHVGNFAGLPLRVLYALVGLAPALLFWTGLVLWLDRLKKRLNRRAAPAPGG
ncbi:PepSY-associated TM helix domain-containing protein [Gloeobacter violaceus]|uniref:Gll0312 protein n=1 Tax=Gloeobacter violaceus (strain ATCC 29082 / PCC 7421) TaxID=251221 RepID=Q7NNU7_GLOVI|nr:PepSY-associated TM helix domain-containing protein [Gloeobacter violaceus]BAC88253.1 gll0312 [Gloeobacter violaceus PCC 7421]